MKNQLERTLLALLLSLFLILALAPAAIAHGISSFDAGTVIPSGVPAGGQVSLSFSYTVFHSHGSNSPPWQDPWVIRLDSSSGPILASGFSQHPARGETITHQVSVSVTIPDGTSAGEHRLYIGVGDDPASSTRQWQYKTITVLQNITPVADAGPDQSVEASGPYGAEVTLDAGKSHHPAGHSLIYQWEWPGGKGSGVSLTSLFQLGTTEVTLTVSDGKGGSSTDSVLVTVGDTIPPVSGSGPGFPPGLNGWHTTDVQLALSASDTGSGIAGIEYNLGGGWIQYKTPVTISEEGSSIIQYRAFDNAGNTEGINTAEIKIDKTPPIINIEADQTYMRRDTVNIIFSASDDFSGLAGLNAGIDGNPLSSETKIEDYTLSPGPHILTVWASDQAGNTSEKTFSFTVKTNIDDLISLADKMASMGHIDKGVYKSLEAKLNAAKAALGRPRPRETSDSLKSFASEVIAQTGRHITDTAASLLIKEAEYLISEG